MSCSDEILLLKRNNLKNRIPTSISVQSSLPNHGVTSADTNEKSGLLHSTQDILEVIFPTILHILFYQMGQKEGKSSTGFPPNTSGMQVDDLLVMVTIIMKT